MGFSDFSERSVIGISSLNKDIVFANDEWLTMFGGRRGALIGRSWEDVLDPGDRAAAGSSWRAFLESRQAYSIRARVRRADQTSVLAKVRYSVLSGKPSGDDLVLIEMDVADPEEAANPACVEFVRDITYELAACMGRTGLRRLTNALIEASSSAERALDASSRASSDTRRLTIDLDRRRTGRAMSR